MPPSQAAHTRSLASDTKSWDLERRLGKGSERSAKRSVSAAILYPMPLKTARFQATQGLSASHSASAPWRRHALAAESAALLLRPCRPGPCCHRHRNRPCTPPLGPHTLGSRPHSAVAGPLAPPPVEVVGAPASWRAGGFHAGFPAGRPDLAKNARRGQGALLALRCIARRPARVCS